jgi:hypothetical protein
MNINELFRATFVHLGREEQLRSFRMRNQTNKLDFLPLLLSMASNQRVGSSNLSGRATFPNKTQFSEIGDGQAGSGITSGSPFARVVC